LSEGKYLATLFNNQARGKPIDPFVFKPLGQLAYVGGSDAVGEIGHWKLTGFATWWVWRATVWVEQNSFRNKVLIGFDWVKTQLFGRDITKF
jgi:NADH dehydrogenase FAD-containing subunit